MKHALLVMQPPYATQIIVQLDGSIMLKFEVERKQSLVDMLNAAILELNTMKVPELPVIKPIQLKGRIIPLQDAPVAKVVPDDGPLPQMKPAPKPDDGNGPPAS